MGLIKVFFFSPFLLQLLKEGTSKQHCKVVPWSIKHCYRCTWFSNSIFSTLLTTQRNQVKDCEIVLNFPHFQLIRKHILVKTDASSLTSTIMQSVFHFAGQTYSTEFKELVSSNNATSPAIPKWHSTTRHEGREKKWTRRRTNSSHHFDWDISPNTWRIKYERPHSKTRPRAISILIPRIGQQHRGVRKTLAKTHF